MLEEKLNEELKTALKGKNAIKASVIRMLKADINNTAIKLKKASLSDEEVLKVIQRHIKQHNDSIEQFKNGNRMDLVEKEEKELVILKTYIPEQISNEKLEALVKDAIKETEATTRKDMGKVIKIVIEKAGGRADGKRVSQAVQKLLSV